MNFAVSGSLPVLDWGSSRVKAGELFSRTDPAEGNGAAGSPGTEPPIGTALDPGAPNINSSNALPAMDALLLGFTPTHAITPPSPTPHQTDGTSPSNQGSGLDAVFGVGTTKLPGSPSLIILA
jgi:hypothetical protein